MRKNKFLHLVFSWRVVFFYSAAIFILSVIPFKAPAGLEFPLLDKIIHSFMYGLLSFFVFNTALKKNIARAKILAFSYSFLFGFVIELVQICLPYRQFESADILANFIGSAGGILLRIF